MSLGGCGPGRAALLLFVGFAVAAPAQAKERLALIIGANEGWAGDQRLRHAERDAENVTAVLTELGDFAPDRVVLLRNPEASEVRAQLQRLARPAEDSLVFVYYSGHADGTYLHLRGAEPLSFDELHRALRESTATVRVGVFDACRSGAIATKGGRLAPAFEVKVLDELTIRGLALLTSSGADELSQEQRSLQGSVFTHHFVSGLRGVADLDRDGRVTLGESYAYAFQRTEAATATTPVPQRPAFHYDLKGQGNVILTWPAQATASLTLPSGSEGRYVIVDGDEARVVAEGTSSQDQQTVLALPPGKYRVKQVLTDKLMVAELTLTKGSRTDAAALSFVPNPLSAGLVKGAESVVHPRRAFWFVAGAAIATGTLWAVAGSRTVALRNGYAQQQRLLTPQESQQLSGWAVTSDVAMGLTAALAISAVFTW